MGTRRDEGADEETGVATGARAQRRLQKPRLFKVLLHNDDFTTMDFVIEILATIFHKSKPDAVAIMLHVHQKGVGMAGVYTHEIAESKVQAVTAIARQYEYPLLCTMEPAESEGDPA